MRMKTKLVCAAAIILCAAGSAFSQEGILEEIGRGLGKAGAPEEERAPYLVRLARALFDRKNYIVYKELYLSTRYSAELRKAEGRNSAGFLLFGTFSGPEGQIGDMNVQFRAAYYNDQFAYGKKLIREYTDRSDDFKPEFHNAYLRLRAIPPLVNVRFGHFYVPFGLQPWIDTHGTLLQSPAMEFIGMDRDWGVAFEGQNDSFEYQVGLTRGSGMDYFERDGNFVLAGKLSTPRIGEHVDEWLGVSYLIGRMYDPMRVEERLLGWNEEEKAEKFPGGIVRRWRAAIDGQKVIGPWRVRFELTGGADAKKESVVGQFLEIKYALGKDSRWSALFQAENLTQALNRSNTDSNTAVRGGLTYHLSANYNLQFVVSQDLNSVLGEKDTWIGVLFYGQKGGGLFSW